MCIQTYCRTCSNYQTEKIGVARSDCEWCSIVYNRANRTDISAIDFSLDGSPLTNVVCEASICLNSKTLTLYSNGLEGDVLSFSKYFIWAPINSSESVV